MDFLTEKNIKKYRRRALFVAKKYKFPYQIALEFSQDYLLMLHEKKWRQTAEQAAIDFIRKRLGRSRNSGSNCGQVLSAEARTNSSFTQRSSSYRRATESYSRAFGINIHIEDYFKRVKPMKRAVYLLSTLYGFTQKEIAFIFCITEGRVCQILKEINDFKST